MASLKRSWVIPFLLLPLVFFAGDGATQQEQGADPWQFPTLTNRKAFQRWWWAFQQRAYPLADITGGARLRALHEIELSKAILPPPSQPVEGDRWVNIGPAPLVGGQIGATGGTRPMSARVADIAVSPGNSNHWLIGAAQGGVWETLDGGTSWTPKTDAQASLAMGAIAFAPSDPNIVYAGTGEAAFSGDSYAGAGLLKSTDGGDTWALLATSTFEKTSFSDISVHRTNPDIALAATTRGIAGRGREFPAFFALKGIFKSTDGGVTWSRKLPGNATDLEVDPASFNNQYAGIGDVFASVDNGVYRSTNAGETWTLINGPWSTLPGGVGRVELAIAPSAPNVLYVSIQDAFDGVGDDGGLLGLFRTDNAWDATPSWTQIPTGDTDDGTGVHGYCGWDRAFNFDSDQCWYDHEIIVDPSNPDTLYAGGIPLWKCATCTATGAAWTEVSKQVADPLNGIHVDHHSMAWAGNRLIVGNDGGVWSTTDGGNTWADHNTNLSTIQFYDGSIHPINPNFALGGSQDNGTGKWTGTDSWGWISGGDGADSAISSSNPDTDWAVSFQNLGIIRTTDGGISFTVADNGIDKAGVPFIARFEKCPANDDVFIAGTDNLWRSNDFFSAVGPAGPSWSPNGPEMGVGITALAFASSDATCGTDAFGTSNGRLLLTADGGATRNDIDVGNSVPNRFVTDLVFDPTDAAILYVTLSGFDEGTPGQPGHLFKTTNALAASPTWFNVSPPVNIPHNTIVLDPFDPSIVYVGTDLGVWKSADGGGTWTHMGPATGMPNVAVFDLQINHTTNRLVAFTHGRGAFVLSTGPAISVTPNSHDFGTVDVGSTADRTFTVQNTGGETLSGGVSTAAPFSIVTGGSFSLGPGASQAVVVRFSPTTAATFAADVDFTSNGGDLARAVTGTGTVAGTLTLSLTTNAVNFGPGDLLTVSVGVDNPGIVSTVDFFFGAVLPDGDTVVFFTDLAFTTGVGSLASPNTLQPIVAGVDLTAPFVFNQPAFFTFPWAGTEPAGSYTLFLAAVKAGALADNSIDPGDIVAVSTAGVVFTP